MARSTSRTVGLGVLALVVVAGVALTVGSVAYGRARTGAEERAAASVRIDGVPRDCGPHRAVVVSLAFEGPGEARFAVDGVEVPSSRPAVAGTDRAWTAALLPAPVLYLRCDEGRAHRYDVLTRSPQGCRWSVAGQRTQEEARGHQWALRESGTGCVLVLD